MSRQFGKKEDDNELVANIIGSIVFAILIILYCVREKKTLLLLLWVLEYYIIINKS